MILTEAGVPIFFRSYSSIEINHILISGFLSAMDEFAKAGMNSELSQVQLVNRYITIKRIKIQKGEEVRFILVHQHCLGFKRQEDCICVPSSLEEISDFFFQFVKTNNPENDINENNLANLAAFADFEDFIDSVVKNHFLNHSIENEFPPDLEFLDVEKISDQQLLGTISYFNNQLFKYHLNPAFSGPKFHKLIKLAGTWSDLLGNDNSESSFPVLEFNDFKLAFSLVFSKTNEKLTTFTLWTPETSSDDIFCSHNHISDTLISELNTKKY